LFAEQPTTKDGQFTGYRQGEISNTMPNAHSQSTREDQAGENIDRAPAQVLLPPMSLNGCPPGIFKGRKDVLQTIYQELVQNPRGGVGLWLHGPSGVGKTSLLRKFQAQFSNHSIGDSRSEQVLQCVYITIIELAGLFGDAPERRFYEQILEQLGKWESSDSPADLTLEQALDQLLDRAARKRWHIVLLIDGAELIGPPGSRETPFPVDPVPPQVLKPIVRLMQGAAPISCIITSTLPLDAWQEHLEKAQVNSSSYLRIITQHRKVTWLDESTVREIAWPLIEQRLGNGSREDELAWIYQQTGGHPLLLAALLRAIWEVSGETRDTLDSEQRVQICQDVLSLPAVRAALADLWAHYSQENGLPFEERRAEILRQVASGALDRALRRSPAFYQLQQEGIIIRSKSEEPRLFSQLFADYLIQQHNSLPSRAIVAIPTHQHAGRAASNMDVYIYGKRVEMARREYELFLLLYASRGEPVPVEKIRQRVWSNESLGAVEQTAHRLKQRLNASYNAPQYGSQERPILPLTMRYSSKYGYELIVGEQPTEETENKEPGDRRTLLEANGARAAGK
jgi:hypothetical protein